MSATTAALIQVSAATLTVAVSMAFVMYVTGTLRPILAAFRHPLRAVETVIAVPMSWLPAPRKRPHRKHYRGKHAA